MNKIHFPEYDSLFDWGKLYTINPKNIKYALTTNEWFDLQLKEWEKVYDGNWGEYIAIEKDFVHSSITEMFTKNIPFEQTSLYQYTSNLINQGKSRWSCDTVEEFKKREEHLRNLFNHIKEHGFQTQEEIEKSTGLNMWRYNGKLVDEPGIVIGKHGKYLYHNGNHRLPMFKILNVPEIKIKVNIRHKSWVDFLLYVYKVNEQIWGDKYKTYQPINHVDFSDFKSEWSNYRVELIKKHISTDCHTLLDIGALWGQFCFELETPNLHCTAVEMNSSFVYIMQKLRQALDINISILEDDIFNLQYSCYDVILAVNIFHHFLKRKETYDKLTSFLKNLQAKEMYFQPHNPDEGQMKNAYINYDKQQFIQYILDNSCFTSCQEIGEENGRKLYKLWRN